jgi:hypothetical protein
MSATARSRPISLPTVGTGAVAAGGVFLIALAVYVRTLLPGSSFGDWGEMQLIQNQLGVPHPTGYPLYMLLGKLFSLIPIGSYAWRADLLSAVAGAGAAAVSVLIAMRLGVRPFIAAVAGLTLAVTGTLWLEATFSEMNGFHLLLVGLVIHRALVWRDERRDRDLQLGGLLAGLALANHLLAVTVLPIVIVFVLVDARHRIRERPVVLLQAAGLVLAGVALYVVIPLRALAGPPSVYASLLTWDGFSSLVSGAMFRGDMHFGSPESFAAAWSSIPDVVDQFVSRANVVFLAVGLAGGVILLVRDRWAGLMLGLLVAANVYVFANYFGNLDHYLLTSWLIVAVWVAVAGEWLISSIQDRLGERAAGMEILLVVLPVVLAAANWAGHDQSTNTIGEQFSRTVFAELPPNAVLLTYWDALTNLSYEHCIDGERPDVSLRAYDTAARVTCDPVTGDLIDVARTRPVYALFPFPDDLAGVVDDFDLVPGPTLAIPYGGRVLDFSGTLYRLVPRQ